MVQIHTIRRRAVKNYQGKAVMVLMFEKISYFRVLLLFKELSLRATYIVLAVKKNFNLPLPLTRAVPTNQKHILAPA